MIEVIVAHIKHMSLGSDKVELNIVSLVVAALIIRVIYVCIGTFKDVVEDIVTPDCPTRYKKTYYCIPNCILTSLISIIACVFIYKWYSDGK